MAIVACKECTREVSDKAPRCPHCGVSIAEAIRPQPRRVKPWLYGALIVVLLAWAALTTLWLTAIIPEPKQLLSFIGTVRGPLLNLKASGKTAEHVPILANAPSAQELKPVNSAVYATSIERLYQDYDANEVAIQSKIGDSPIRVSGAVAEISEDLSGHPVVTLSSGSNNGADMVLSDDQKSAAARLSKEDEVEIQCSKLQRIEARLRGSGCALMLLDADANPVYLAVSMSGKAGSAPLYIVGPMPRKTCLASSDTIAAQVNSNPKNDHVLSKSCTATARESASLDDCHLSSTMPAIPDLPTAHLWKYDCMAPSLEPRKAAQTAASKNTPRRAAAQEASVEITTLPEPAAAPEPERSDAVAPVPKIDDSAAPAVGTAPAAVRGGEAGGSQPPATAPVQSTIATAAVPTTAVPITPAPTTAAPAVADDLVPVRAKDPDAADRIVSYCGKITSGATNPTLVAARCRQDEMNAWTRLVIQNEFPTLDESSRRKCNEPPFPDSFVARESCAKYQLHVD